MTAFEALARSRADFERRLRDVRPADWGLSTPCDRWSVYDLVNHVVGGVIRYTMLLHGASAATVDATRRMDHLGPDALGAFRRNSDDMIAAFHEPGALRRLVHHRAGDRTGAELLEMRILEFTVHGWDLARALGADETLDPETVERVFRRLADSPTRDGHRSFAAPPGQLSVDAPLQERMLHLTGRDPGYR